jgi:Flp pilus assembly protein CpaB
MVGVVVARRDLQRGDPVNAETMAVRQIPSDLAPSDLSPTWARRWPCRFGPASRC